jgi:hypothetical protein
VACASSVRKCSLIRHDYGEKVGDCGEITGLDLLGRLVSSLAQWQ